MKDSLLENYGSLTTCDLGMSSKWGCFSRDIDENTINYDQLACGSKKLKPEFSRISGGGSMSEISKVSIDLERSSTENGILQYNQMRLR